MTSEDSARDELYRLLQSIYFDAIDRADAATAVDAFDEDVEWVHTQVWEHDGHDRSKTDTLRGRESVREFLAARISEMQVEGIQHRVREVISDGRIGAFRAEVVGPAGRSMPFLGWVEITDGKISSYIVTPLL
jgi:ketosteroid isomerase-like protein